LCAANKKICHPDNWRDLQPVTK